MGTYLVKRVTRLSGTPHSIAAGVACGVAMAVTPFIGFHLLGALLLSWLVRGNYIASALGTLVCNPWTFPFIWFVTYKLGHVLLGTRAAQVEPIEHWDLTTFFGEAVEHVQAVFWPAVVGGVALAVVAGLVTYFPLVRMIAAYREARARRRQGRRGVRSEGASPETGLP
jgi:uncharacterized protein (DUF2062 family)